MTVTYKSKTKENFSVTNCIYFVVNLQAIFVDRKAKNSLHKLKQNIFV